MYSLQSLMSVLHDYQTLSVEQGVFEADQRESHFVFDVLDKLRLPGARAQMVDRLLSESSGSETAAHLGLLTLQQNLRGAVILKTVHPGMGLSDFDKLALFLPGASDLADGLYRQAWSDPHYNVRAQTSEYVTDMPRFFAGMAAGLPVDYRTGLLEAATYVSQLQADSPDQILSYAQATLSVDKGSTLAGLVAQSVVEDGGTGLVPAWVDADKTSESETSVSFVPENVDVMTLSREARSR